MEEREATESAPPPARAPEPAAPPSNVVQLPLWPEAARGQGVGCPLNNAKRERSVTWGYAPGEKLERARALIGKGLTVRGAATRLRVGKTALYEALRARQNLGLWPSFD
jgi:hypothetical protein